ncbi:MAG: hypothetical protein H0W64_09340 [Gammaproteobacteria bacterium]|nr:hypothetical protein [Gammaproteobacteria bacterium]
MKALFGNYHSYLTDLSQNRHPSKVQTNKVTAQFNQLKKNNRKEYNESLDIFITDINNRNVNIVRLIQDEVEDESFSCFLERLSLERINPIDSSSLAPDLLATHNKAINISLTHLSLTGKLMELENLIKNNSIFAALAEYKKYKDEFEIGLDPNVYRHLKYSLVEMVYTLRGFWPVQDEYVRDLYQATRTFLSHYESGTDKDICADDFKLMIAKMYLNCNYFNINNNEILQNLTNSAVILAELYLKYPTLPAILDFINFYYPIYINSFSSSCFIPLVNEGKIMSYLDHLQAFTEAMNTLSLANPNFKQVYQEFLSTLLHDVLTPSIQGGLNNSQYQQSFDLAKLSIKLLRKSKRAMAEKFGNVILQTFSQQLIILSTSRDAIALFQILDLLKIFMEMRPLFTPNFEIYIPLSHNIIQMYHLHVTPENFQNSKKIQEKGGFFISYLDKYNLENLNEINTNLLIQTYYSYGNIYQKLNEYSQAIPHYEKAFRTWELNRAKSNNNINIDYLLRDLVFCYFEPNKSTIQVADVKIALKKCIQATSYAQQIENPDIFDQNQLSIIQNHIQLFLEFSEQLDLMQLNPHCYSELQKYILNMANTALLNKNYSAFLDYHFQLLRLLEEIPQVYYRFEQSLQNYEIFTAMLSAASILELAENRTDLSNKIDEFIRSLTDSLLTIHPNATSFFQSYGYEIGEQHLKNNKYDLAIQAFSLALYCVERNLVDSQDKNLMSYKSIIINQICLCTKLLIKSKEQQINYKHILSYFSHSPVKSAMNNNPSHLILSNDNHILSITQFMLSIHLEILIDAYKLRDAEAMSYTAQVLSQHLFDDENFQIADEITNNETYQKDLLKILHKGQRYLTSNHKYVEAINLGTLSCIIISLHTKVDDDLELDDDDEMESEEDLVQSKTRVAETNNNNNMSLDQLHEENLLQFSTVVNKLLAEKIKSDQYDCFSKITKPTDILDRLDVNETLIKDPRKNALFYEALESLILAYADYQFHTNQPKEAYQTYCSFETYRDVNDDDETIINNKTMQFRMLECLIAITNHALIANLYYKIEFTDNKLPIEDIYLMLQLLPAAEQLQIVTYLTSTVENIKAYLSSIVIENSKITNDTLTLERLMREINAQDQLHQPSLTEFHGSLFNSNHDVNSKNDGSSPQVDRNNFSSKN